MQFLDAHAIAAIIQGFVYLLVAVACCVCLARRVAKRRTGWVMLVLLCVVQVAMSVLRLLLSQFPTSVPLGVAATSLDAVSLAPLVNAVSGFTEIWTVGVLEHEFLMRTALPLLQFFPYVAVLLFLVGWADIVSARSQHDVYTGTALRRAGFVVIACVLAALAAAVVYLLFHRAHVMRNRRLRFSPTTGSVALYAALDLAPALVVALVLLGAALAVPLHKDGFVLVRGARALEVRLGTVASARSPAVQRSNSYTFGIRSVHLEQLTLSHSST
ncbi:uncharacterized protein BXZ73DRAFT_103189 [Epithele typhae]|uniref:uncharacterized protein n=1 Tax=Epithele typhae TaxID=378194 RepID=UPI0020085A21|nr:uncharacterized protein BXZ73DRAFT_103189 [Epithele typhae]KAH9925656.1 hypothetical protein BXZ73DRAFT_103189 [Epithele typhae]